MRLSAPKRVTWWIAVIVGGLAILSKFTSLPIVGGNEFAFVAVGFILLVLATALKGL
jgi:hypothetical protein